MRSTTVLPAAQPAGLPGYKIWQVILAATVGTMIEWYDFFIFGSLTTVLVLKFYPPGNGSFAYLAYLATFAIGCVVRPSARCSSAVSAI